MLTMKCFQAAAVTLAALGFGFTGPDAFAGSCGSQRSHHSGARVSAHFGGDNYRVSVSVGSGRHYDRGYSRRVYHNERSYHYRSNRCDTQVVRYVETRPSGYWTQVYHPPVYETRYRSCGTPYRVCISAGYYEQVWVSTGNCRY